MAGCISGWRTRCGPRGPREGKVLLRGSRLAVWARQFAFIGDAKHVPREEMNPCEKGGSISMKKLLTLALGVAVLTAFTDLGIA